VTRMLLSRLAGILLIAAVPANVQAQPDDNVFKLYAARISVSLPLRPTYPGEGVYLGQGKILTAAHLIPSSIGGSIEVNVAGATAPAITLRNGSAQHVDLALLSIDEANLPLSIRLRRNPFCRAQPKVGMDALIVSSGESAASHVISPASIAPELQSQYQTLIAMPGASGSGLYDPEQKCLLGIMSAKMEKYSSVPHGGRSARIADGYAGYFVPVSVIIPFLKIQL
jgi:Trypsin-like peptidase domain